MTSGTFPGIHAVLYAMFDAHERLDRAAMRAQVQACLGAGVDGIVVLGLATEVAKLSERECREVVDWAAEDIGGRVPLGVTIYGNATASQRALLRDAEWAGADWLILQPPSVGQFAAAELARGFGRLADAASKPVAIQNAPGLMGRGLDAGEIVALVEAHPNVTHLKGEMPVLQLAPLIAACGDRLIVLNGQAGLEMIDSLRAGCRGFVLAPDMVDHAVRIWRYWQSGDEAAAEAAYAAVLPEIVFAMRSLEHLVTYGKRIFARRAGLAAGDRAPGQAATEFGLACVERYAAVLGPYGAATC
ncbi:MAG: dihydrodipicolinate synthase family protein [Geminicoccaceae bacterium]